jgi:NADH-quinone oxidoreductase subunit N
MLFFLLSLAGIPPLAGFWGKYFIFLSLMETGHYVLASVAVLYAVVGLYYYMRIANAMFMKQAADAEPIHLSPGMATALGVTAIGTIGIGIFPNVFIQFVTWSLSAAGNVSSITQAVR